MTRCHVADFRTPDGVLLNTLWFGPTKPKRAIIWVHGLGSSAFSKLDIVERLVDQQTAVLTFNNRGHGSVNRISRAESKKGEYIGGAHEKFTDCVDDVQGAVNFARRAGAKEIYLVGHSTGCQKIVYWGHRKRGRGVKGLILLAPISDYAAGIKLHGKVKIERVALLARAMIRRGRGRELIPQKVWNEELDDAYRFLSLYTPDSIEQSIFPYFDEARPAHIFGSVHLPVLAVFAARDEFADRPADKLAAWFEDRTASQYFSATIASRANHGFKNAEAFVARAVHNWLDAPPRSGTMSR